MWRRRGGQARALGWEDPCDTHFLSSVCPGLWTLPGGTRPAPGPGRRKRRTSSETGSKLPKDTQQVSKWQGQDWAGLLGWPGIGSFMLGTPGLLAKLTEKRATSFRLHSPPQPPPPPLPQAAGSRAAAGRTLPRALSAPRRKQAPSVPEDQHLPGPRLRGNPTFPKDRTPVPPAGHVSPRRGTAWVGLRPERMSPRDVLCLRLVAKGGTATQLY